MGKHFNAIHDDATWRSFFTRWHAGERSDALRREAKVSHDTWTANAGRLKMRIMDLPEGHPGRRRVPAFADRPDDYRHPGSALTEGQWRELFRLRAAGATDKALTALFGPCAATICTQAEARGLRRVDLREAARAAIEAAGTPGEPAVMDLGLGVAIDPTDPEATRRAFDAAIAEAGARGDYAGMIVMARAKGEVGKALFSPGGYRPSAYLSPQTGMMPGGYRSSSYLSPQTPVAGLLVGPESGEAIGGEGEAAPPLVLRPEQTAPEGDWATWLFLGGRGAGKTLAGASWIADQAESVGRLALIGPSLHDAREVMIGGPSGILALPRWAAMGAWPVYEPSRRRLRFPSGAEAWVFSAEDPESLRGPQFGAAWADEFCAWRGCEATLALLRMGLRLKGGDGAPPPRLMVSTTPKPTRALKGLMAEGSCVVSRAATVDNAENLAPGFVEGLEALYGGTRRAAQELEGRVVEIEGALFTSKMMADCRTEGGFKPWGRLGVRCEGGGVFERVVVGVDPTTTAGGDACGIVVVGRRRRADGRSEAVVLADRSARGLSPEGWARRARTAAEAWGANAIVVEVNQGGEMVRAVFKAVGCETPIKEVRAAEGKRARAEPVAALYEQRRVLHAGDFGDLEEELMAVGGEDDGRWSLDRADALVWAVTALIVTEAAPPRIRML